MGKYDEVAIARARARRKTRPEPALRPSMRQAILEANVIMSGLDTMGIPIDYLRRQPALGLVDILVVGEPMPIRVFGFTDEPEGG